MKNTFLFFAVLGIVSFSIMTNQHKSIKKQLAFIPSGNVTIGAKTKSVQAFYMSKNEVTNKEYRSFLADLKKNNKLDDYKIAVPDTSNWISVAAGKSQAYMDYYFSHPSYDNFPVVNVSYEGANLFCAWFTTKANEGNESYEAFRLPTREEFIRACRGEKSAVKYAWGSDAIRNKKGQILANFKLEATANIASNLSDNTDILAPSESYWPNTHGIYNLNGNAAEMIAEKGIAVGGSWMQSDADIQNESTLKYEGSGVNIGFRMVSTSLVK